MRTFKAEPNHLVRFNPPIGNIKFAKFDENGLYSTDNERIIKRFYHAFDSVPGLSVVEEEPEGKTYKCKQCDYTTQNKGELMAHYRADHPKED